MSQIGSQERQPCRPRRVHEQHLLQVQDRRAVGSTRTGRSSLQGENKGANRRRACKRRTRRMVTIPSKGHRYRGIG